MGTGQPPLGAVPADVRGRPARDSRGGRGAGQAAAWQTLADTILADVAADSVHPSGRWQRAPDDERVDAALLLAAIRGRRPRRRPAQPGHPAGGRRTTWPGTATCTGSGTTSGRCSEAEGAFVLCGFLMALALHQQGRHRRGGRLVRAQPGRLRAASPVHRGVRRRPAPVARQPAAGVRACADVRGRGPADPALGAAVRPGGPAGPRRLCLARGALGVAYLTWAGTGRRAAPAGPWPRCWPVGTWLRPR